MVARKMSNDEKEALMLRQVRAEPDRDTVERHDGLSVAMEKIVQREQENPASNGRERIDDFRLRGSRPCRHMGGHLSIGGWRT